MQQTMAEVFATIQAILDAQITFGRISTLILLILGNIGELLNIIVFLRRTFRTNSCAIYFLAAAGTRLLFLDLIILLNGLAIGKFTNIERSTKLF